MNWKCGGNFSVANLCRQTYSESCRGGQRSWRWTCTRSVPSEQSKRFPTWVLGRAVDLPC